MTGIEPALSAWEADVLPLNYIRLTRHFVSFTPAGCTYTPAALPPPCLKRASNVPQASERRNLRLAHVGRTEPEPIGLSACHEPPLTSPAVDGKLPLRLRRCPAPGLLRCLLHVHAFEVCGHGSRTRPLCVGASGCRLASACLARVSGPAVLDVDCGDHRSHHAEAGPG